MDFEAFSRAVQNLKRAVRGNAGKTGPMTKVCSQCGMEKHVDCFYKHAGAKDGRRGDCRTCHIAKAKCRHGTPEYVAKRSRWLKKYNQSERRKSLLESYNLKRYGMSKAEYEAVLMGQQYCCKICLAPHRPNESRGRLYVDHCHKTGKVRALLCKTCNSLLGFAKDDKSILDKAIEYLLAFSPTRRET